jgi:hypothetical protein
MCVMPIDLHFKCNCCTACCLHDCNEHVTATLNIYPELNHCQRGSYIKDIR